MRHDPAGAAIVVMLRDLKMFGMAQAAGELMEQGAPAFNSAVPILSQLLKAETAEREVRSVAYQLKVARFPIYKDLSGFDFASARSMKSWCASCTGVSSLKTPIMLSSSVVREPARPTSPRRLACRRLNTLAKGLVLRDCRSGRWVDALEQEKVQGRSVRSRIG